MKRILFLLISLLLMNYSNLSCKPLVSDFTTSSDDSIRVMTTPDLYSLSLKWADEYNRLFPGAKILVKSLPESTAEKNLLQEGTIGFVSGGYTSGYDSESVLRVVVGRDIIVPVINAKNPYLEEIGNRGIAPEAFAKFFSNSESQNWGVLLGNSNSSHAGCFVLNNESVKKSLAGFLKTDINNITSGKAETGVEMLLAIQNDPFAIGFCKMTDIIDAKNQSIVENVSLLPIDRNGNGLIDYNEKIYDDLNSFSRGVWIGKYPKALINNIYSVSSIQPENEAEVAFLKWVMSDGQQFLNGNGYSDLLVSERQSNADKLYNAKIYAAPSTDNLFLLKTLLFVITTLVIAGLIANVISRARKSKSTEAKITRPVLQPFLNENSLIIPAGLYFDKAHTWAFMEQNGFVKVGIDDFLQHLTGTLTRIKMKNQGDEVKKGEQILSIVQNGKQLNLYSPISGVIREQNITLNTNSSLLNSSPYTEGWIYKIEPLNWARENQLLFMAEKYRQYIKNEFSRLKDFLAASLNPDAEKYAQVVLQDGGELRDNILSDMGPEAWEDFQTKFIDPSRQIWFYELF